MNLEDIDMGSINEVISSLSDDDMESLKNMAQSLFSGQNNAQNVKQEQPKPQIHNSGMPNIDFASIAKIASFMNIMSNDRKDPRCDLLNALRPMLSDDKQQKVDQAIKMLRLMSLIPKLKEIND